QAPPACLAALTTPSVAGSQDAAASLEAMKQAAAPGPPAAASEDVAATNRAAASQAAAATNQATASPAAAARNQAAARSRSAPSGPDPASSSMALRRGHRSHRRPAAAAAA